MSEYRRVAMGSMNEACRAEPGPVLDRREEDFEPEKPRRRSSASVTLVLIGAASVQGCGDPGPATVQRDLYEHRSKCVQDWGDERKCELITDGQHRGYWYGPGFVGSRGAGYSGYRGTPDGAGDTAPGKNAVGSHRVSRSGFGSSASAHSSGS